MFKLLLLFVTISNNAAINNPVATLYFCACICYNKFLEAENFWDEVNEHLKSFKRML
jgi:hypothetical protein